jgi:hypothetical protein
MRLIIEGMLNHRKLARSKNKKLFTYLEIYINKKTGAEKYKVFLVDLFNEFEKNDLYINMTKEVKRTFNRSKLSEKWKNVFL